MFLSRELSLAAFQDDITAITYSHIFRRRTTKPVSHSPARCELTISLKNHEAKIYGPNSNRGQDHSSLACAAWLSFFFGQ